MRCRGFVTATLLTDKVSASGPEPVAHRALPLALRALPLALGAPPVALRAGPFAPGAPLRDTVGTMSTLTCTLIRLRTRSRLLTVDFDDGRSFDLPFEYLRVNSPSAEVQGHGRGQRVTVSGKENVVIKAVEPVGHYAVRLVFDDGHDSGLYTWKYLHELGRQREAASGAT